MFCTKSIFALRKKIKCQASEEQSVSPTSLGSRNYIAVCNSSERLHLTTDVPRAAADHVYRRPRQRNRRRRWCVRQRRRPAVSPPPPPTRSWACAVALPARYLPAIPGCGGGGDDGGGDGLSCQGALDWAAAASVAAAKGRLGLREARRGGAPAPLSLIAANRTAICHNAGKASD